MHVDLNQLTGRIPTEFAKLTNLIELSLGKLISSLQHRTSWNTAHPLHLECPISNKGQNKLIGLIPSNLGELRFLKVIDVREWRPSFFDDQRSILPISFCSMSLIRSKWA